MEPYRVGALADLISSSKVKAENGETKKSKKKASLGDLFVSKLPPQQPAPKPVKPVAAKSENGAIKEGKKSSKKRKSEKLVDQKAGDENEVPKKKKVKKEEVSDDDDDDINGQFTKPSLRYQVRQEDLKERIRDEEKDGRTVFVGNLPGETTERSLRQMFKKFGDIESVRFRGAARPDPKTTKKVAVIKRKFHEKHQRIIAYVRFKEADCASKSCELNGTDLSGCVMRVDMATATPAERDQKRAIFVGNLPFTVEEDDVRNHFQDCGKIDSVRLVRDSATGMGKGFGYVNFESADSVETAILKNGTSLQGRDLRVGRSVRKPKATVQLAQKVKKSKLEKSKKKPVLVNKKVVKVSKKKVREATTMSFQGQKAEGTDGGDSKAKKPKKKNKLEMKKKKIAQQFAKD